MNSVIIPPNTRIPATSSQGFKSRGQQEILVQYTQGDDNDPAYVKVLGEQVLAIPPYPKGAQIEVKFAYDIDQTVSIEVTDQDPELAGHLRGPRRREHGRGERDRAGRRSKGWMCTDGITHFVNLYEILQIPPTPQPTSQVRGHQQRRQWVKRQRSSDPARRTEAETRVREIDQAEKALLNPDTRATFDRDLATTTGPPDPVRPAGRTGPDQDWLERAKAAPQGDPRKANYAAREAINQCGATTRRPGSSAPIRRSC